MLFAAAPHDVVCVRRDTQLFQQQLLVRQGTIETSLKARTIKRDKMNVEMIFLLLVNKGT